MHTARVWAAAYYDIARDSYRDLLGAAAEYLACVSEFGFFRCLDARFYFWEVERQVRRSRIPGRWLGPADAMKHCLAMCRWAKNSRLGERFARRVAEFHEAIGGSASPEDAAMDRHNNGVGIECGRAGRASRCWDCCAKALWGGKAHVLQNWEDPGGPGGPGRSGPWTSPSPATPPPEPPTNWPEPGGPGLPRKPILVPTEPGGGGLTPLGAGVVPYATHGFPFGYGGVG